MFLADQLQRFVATRAPGVSLSVCFRSGERVVLVQDFTADQAQLKRTILATLPRFPPSVRATNPASRCCSRSPQTSGSCLDAKPYFVYWWRSSAVQRRQHPQAGQCGITCYVRRFGKGAHRRIPDRRTRVDDRLSNGGSAGYGTAAGSDGSYLALLGDPYAAHRVLLLDVAQATGGVAFYNTNGVAQAARKVIENEHSFYTLSYTPTGFQTWISFWRVATPTSSWSCGPDRGAAGHAQCSIGSAIAPRSSSSSMRPAA